MLYRKTLLLILYLSFFQLNYLVAQTKKVFSELSKDELISYTDEFYGADDLLFNGIKYQPIDARVNGNLFFEYKESGNSKLFIKGQVFKNINIKFDIHSEKLVLVKLTNDGIKKKIALNSSYVDSFYLGNHVFINLKYKKDTISKSKYFEKIYSEKDIFLKEYKKTVISLYDDYNPKGKYSDQKYTYYIYSNNNLVKISTKKAFLNFYNPYKKDIQKYMKENKIAYKSANNEEIIKLMTFCHAKSK